MLKQSFNGMKRTLAILLAVLFVVSVTAAVASAHGPVMVKEKKTVVIAFQKEKTIICKWPEHHKWHHHHGHKHKHHKLMKAVKEFMD